LIDILFAIIPKLEPFAPTTGPALLKSHCEAGGLTATVRDYNIDLYNWLKKKGLHEQYFHDDDSGFITWFDRKFVYPEEWYELYDIIEPKLLDWIREIKRINPTWVGLSMLSSASVCVGRKMCELLREHAPQIKIVIGGAAVRKENKMWLDEGWIDYFIYGDGEFSIVELLKGNTGASGINSPFPNQVEDLNTILMPNYDDINWTHYEFEAQYAPIYVTGSRGCVKRCTFCDVPLLWPKYKWRSAEHLFREVELMYKKHGRRMFRFTDSLINGSMSQFRTFLKMIKKFNRGKYDIEQIKWWSQWIVRARGQMLEEDFELMKQSNVNELDIGLESFSESVRWHMGKKFTDDDLWWNLEMMHKYNIHYTLLMITGYPTETLEDHHHTLASIKRMSELGYLTPRGNSTSTAYLSFGNTMLIQPDYKIYKMLKDDPDYIDCVGDNDWSYRDNTLDERLRRHREIHELVQELSGVESSWLQKKHVREIEKNGMRKHRDAEM